MPIIHQTIYHLSSYLHLHPSTRNLFIHLPTHPSTNPPIRLSIHQPIHSSAHLPTYHFTPIQALYSPMYLYNHQIKKYPFLFPFILSAHIWVTPVIALFLHHGTKGLCITYSISFTAFSPQPWVVAEAVSCLPRSMFSSPSQIWNWKAFPSLPCG